MNTLNTSIDSAIDYAAIKMRQTAAWASGDYAVVGTTLQIVGEQLCESIDLKPGSKVLDVAAGNGNATLAAARRFADVTSTDYVGELLDKPWQEEDQPGVVVGTLRQWLAEAKEPGWLAGTE